LLPGRNQLEPVIKPGSNQPIGLGIYTDERAQKSIAVEGFLRDEERGNSPLLSKERWHAKRDGVVGIYASVNCPQLARGS
jgi:hypothetical protein